MQCPVDEETLVIAERSGVELDCCPKCRGVWLDRGELDKLIERAAPSTPEPAQSRESDYPPSDNPHSTRKKKKESFLGDLFDLRAR